MLNAGHDLAFGRAIAGQLVGDHDAGRSHLPLQQLTGAAMRCSALAFKRARRSSSSRPLPPASVCLDIFLLPGASDVATHVERLSSNETNKVAQSPGMPVRSGTGRLVPSCIGRSLNSVVGDVDLAELVAPPA